MCRWVCCITEHRLLPALLLFDAASHCRDPITILRVLRQLGPSQLLPWAVHYCALTAYAVGNALLAPLRPLAPRSWHWQRLLDALEVGSGADYRRHHDDDDSPVEPMPAEAVAASSASAAAA